MVRILFYATSPNQGTGYSTVGNQISNYLAEKDDIEFYYFSIHNFKHQKVSRYISNKINFIDVNKDQKESEFGYDIFYDCLIDIEPDIIVIYNDIIVTCGLLNVINTKFRGKSKVVSYLDLVYPDETYKKIDFIKNSVDHVIFFSDYWYKWGLDFGFDKERISIMYHGLKKLKKIDKIQSREKINMPVDGFVLLNSNRNSERKALDITISGFLKFYKMVRDNGYDNNKLYLYLNCSLTSVCGFDIIDIIDMFCKKENLDSNIIKNTNILIFQTKIDISDETLEYLYNACDVGVNSCTGEGFGLCNMEHASLGKAQVISNVGGLSDIFNHKYVEKIEPVFQIYLPNLHGFNGYASYCDPNDFAKAFYKYYIDEKKLIQDGIYCENDIHRRFKWDVELPKLYEVLTNIIKSV